MKFDITGFKEEYPFRSNYKTVNGFKYHYVDEGAGKPVLMIHGNPTWSFYFRNLIKALSPDFRTIAVDHIGCGLSEKPDAAQYNYTLERRVSDLEALVDQLDLKEKITLVVHDWGGMIGCAYALRHPERIAGIVVTNTAAFFPPGKRYLPFRLWLLKTFGAFAREGILGLNLFAFSALVMASKKGLSPFAKSGLIAPYNSRKNRIATLKFVEDIPLGKKDKSHRLVKFVDDNLHKLSGIPKLVCWGRHDFVFDTNYFNEWKKRFPMAQFHMFEDAGHYLFEDEGERTSRIIRDFLQENTG